jgi:26S proteasome regulatory subunit N10
LQAEEDYSEVMNDPEFLQSVLEGLPGVDPQSEAIRSAMGQLIQKDSSQTKQNDTNKSDKK